MPEVTRQGCSGNGPKVGWHVQRGDGFDHHPDRPAAEGGDPRFSDRAHYDLTVGGSTRGRQVSPAFPGAVIRDVRSITTAWFLDFFWFHLALAVVLGVLLPPRPVAGIAIAAFSGGITFLRYIGSSVSFDTDAGTYVVRNPFRTHRIAPDQIIARASQPAPLDRSKRHRRLLISVGGGRRYGFRPRGWLRVVAVTSDLLVLVPGFGTLPDAGRINPWWRLLPRRR
jgi:hypothetical protein